MRKHRLDVMLGRRSGCVGLGHIDGFDAVDPCIWSLNFSHCLRPGRIRFESARSCDADRTTHPALHFAGRVSSRYEKRLALSVVPT